MLALIPIIFGHDTTITHVPMDFRYVKKLAPRPNHNDYGCASSCHAAAVWLYYSSLTIIKKMGEQQLLSQKRVISDSVTEIGKDGP